MSRWVSTCRTSAPRAPRTGSGAWMCAILSHFAVPIRVLGLMAGTQVPAAPLPGRCLGTAPPQCSSDPAQAPAGLSPGSAHTRLRLRPWDPAPPAAPRLRHGESTICCEALPQLPTASPRASVERRVSGRGAGPRAGTNHLAA